MASGDPLPPYAYFMPTTRTFKIIAPLTGINNILVKAYDKSDQFITTPVKITFTNAAPTFVSKMPTSITINTQENFEYRIPFTSYKDPVNQALTISTNINTLTTGIKGWLRFSNLTWTFSGMPPVTAAGTYTIKLSISDPYGGVIAD